MDTLAVYSFDDAMKTISLVKTKHLLLGNGFSIALKPDIFTYGSLYENADFSAALQVKLIFEKLGTQDFEVVIKSLQDAAKILSVYRPAELDLINTLQSDAATIKEALVSAIAKRHPDRPYDVSNEQYRACRNFLSQFDHIYTLNYDVILYWTLMQSEVDELNLRPDDGFRHPEDDPDGTKLPYVSWQQGHQAKVHYLHGALHLFDRNTEITKYTWSKTQLAIVDQIREALADDKFPLFVAEGESESKKERILHNAYLHKALRSFESCCANRSRALVIFGHSLADNDAHILRCIAAGGISTVLIGIYGDTASPQNQKAIASANALVERRKALRGESCPLKLVYYDAASAKIWG